MVMVKKSLLSHLCITCSAYEPQHVNHVGQWEQYAAVQTLETARLSTYKPAPALKCKAAGPAELHSAKN